MRLAASILSLVALCFMISNITEAADPLMDWYGDPLPAGAVARLGTVRFGVGIHVWNMHFSADGKTLTSVGRDGRSIDYWDAVTGKRLVLPKPLVLPKYYPGSDLYVCSPNNRVMACENVQGILIRDRATFKQLQHFRLDDKNWSVGSLYFSPDESVLVATLAIPVGRTHRIYFRLWNLNSGKELITIHLPFEKEIHGPRFSPDGKMLMWTCENTLHLLELATLKERRSYMFEADGIEHFILHPSGRAVAVLDWVTGMMSRSRIQVIDLVSRKILFTREDRGNTFRALAYSPDGNTLVSSSESHQLLTQDPFVLWDAWTGKRLRQFGSREGTARALAFSPNGKTLATGGTLNLWELATGKLLHSTRSHVGQIRSAAFSPNGKFFATGAENMPERNFFAHGSKKCPDYALRIWDAGTGRELYKLASDQLSVDSVTFSSDNKTMTSHAPYRRKSPTFQIWDLTTGMTRQNSFDENYNHLFQTTADGKTFVVGKYNQDENQFTIVHLIEATSGETIHSFRGPGLKYRENLAFSSDRKSYFLIGDKVIQALTTDSNKKNFTLKIRDTEGKKYAPRLFLSPNDRYLAALSSAPYLQIWDLSCRKRLTEFDNFDKAIVALIFSPDGQRFAAKVQGEVGIMVYETATAKVLGRMVDDRLSLDPLCFSADGNRFATACSNNTVLIWDVRELRPK